MLKIKDFIEIHLKYIEKTCIVISNNKQIIHGKWEGKRLLRYTRISYKYLTYKRRRNMDITLDHKIVTNNPAIKNNYDNLIFVEGSYEDVVFKVRDLVQRGSEIINHPLGASIRMFFSPYRSIIIREDVNSDSEFHINTIETSIETYKKQMDERTADVENDEDYSLIDRQLLDSALEEFQRIYN